MECLPTMRSLRYIIVDDDPLSNFACTAVIKNEISVASVRCFTEAIEALRFIESDLSMTRLPIPAILFLDISMPSISGWDVLGKLNDFPSKIKEQLTLYILSATLNYVDRALACSYPLVAGCILKPLTTEKLRQIITVSKKIQVAKQPFPGTHKTMPYENTRSDKRSKNQ